MTEHYCSDLLAFADVPTFSKVFLFVHTFTDLPTFSTVCLSMPSFTDVPTFFKLCLLVPTFAMCQFYKCIFKPQCAPLFRCAQLLQIYICAAMCPTFQMCPNSTNVHFCSNVPYFTNIPHFLQWAFLYEFH